MDETSVVHDEHTTGPHAPTSDNQLEVLLASFATGWTTHHPTGAAQLDADELDDIGRQAGEQAAAAAAWRRRIGAMLDTETVTTLLGVSRQALDSRKRSGSVIALAGSGTSHYPAWQFDVGANTATVRPVTLRIVTEFRERVDDVSSFTIASWSTSPQPELDDRTPAEWITSDGDDAPVVLAARRAAHLEAQ